MMQREIQIPVPNGFRTFKYALMGEIDYHIDESVAVSAELDVEAIKRKESLHELIDGLADEIASKPILLMHAVATPAHGFFKSYSWGAYRLVNWTGT